MSGYRGVTIGPNVLGGLCESMPRLLFPVDVQSDFFFAVLNGHISLC